TLVLFSLLLPPPPSSTLFPYTTLFRSQRAGRRAVGPGHGEHHRAVRRRDGAADRRGDRGRAGGERGVLRAGERRRGGHLVHHRRSEEHTSELQSRGHLVCRLLLEKKKK